MTTTNNTNHEKLILGSASWTNRYGAFNELGATIEEVGEILSLALSQGITTIDTAPSYGDAESSIGISRVREAHLEIISRLPHDHWKSGLESAMKSVRRSLRESGATKLAGLMLHNSKSVIEEPLQVQKFMTALKLSGQIASWGVSVYTPTELEEVLRLSRPDFVQFPMSVANLSFLNSGLLHSLMDSGIEAHVRSTFLQGLLLQKANRLPSHFKPWQELLRSHESLASHYQLSKLELVLLPIFSHSLITRVSLGVNSASQLFDVVQAIDSSKAFPGLEEFIMLEDPALLDPRLWPA